jgi:anti-sigma factor RsiW
MSERGHFSDEIQQFLDGRLPDERRAALEEHLAACESCRREREAISAVRAAARRALGPREVPPEFSQAIHRALDRETPAAPTPVRFRARLVLAAGLLAAALAVILILLPRKPNIPAAVEADFEAYRTGRLALALETADTRTMETFFAANGISFRTRVFDLGMMKYRLAGGRVHRLAGRTSALFVYLGEKEKTLICEMYEGRVEELPPAAERREHGGFTFFIYRHRGMTAVFWQEGPVTCVLVSDIDSEEVIALAFAKAMKA